MDGLPMIVYLFGAGLLLVLSVLGLRGLLEVREALRLAEFDRLSAPAGWLAARALAAAAAAVPALLLASHGAIAVLAGFAAGSAGFWLAPRWLEAMRRRAERRILDDLPLHLDLLALAMESGSSWPAALTLCVERAPDGALRRAWERVILEIHAGVEPLEALRQLEQRIRLPPFATLVSALRAAEKLRLTPAEVLRDRARQSAAAKFARAERQARAAPLKLWAAMMLCLAPCTAVVLAYPLARWLTP